MRKAFVTSQQLKTISTAPRQGKMLATVVLRMDLGLCRNTGPQRPAYNCLVFLWVIWKAGTAAGVLELFQYSADYEKMGEQALVL